MFRTEDNVLYESFKFVVGTIVGSVSQLTTSLRTMDEIPIEGDAMCMKTFEQQTVLDVEA